MYLYDMDADSAESGTLIKDFVWEADSQKPIVITDGRVRKITIE